MSKKIQIELEAIDAVNVIGLMQHLISSYRIHPRAMETINRYVKEVNDNLTQEHLEDITAQVETDIMLSKLGIDQEYGDPNTVQLKPPKGKSWEMLGKMDENDTGGLQRTSFDAMRFQSEEEAQIAGEIYQIDYDYPVMRVTDPDGKVTELALMYNPIAGLDVMDAQTLSNFLNNDMDKRAKYE